MINEYLTNQTILEVSDNSWATTLTSDAIQLNKFCAYDQIGFIVSWSGLVGTLTSTKFDIQVSNDGTNWAKFCSSIAVISASDCVAMSSFLMPYNYMRIVATAGSISAGNFKATYTLK